MHVTLVAGGCPGGRRKTDGLFLEACQEASKKFPDIKFDECLLDRACLNVRAEKGVR